MSAECKYTHEDLVVMQALPLSRKILIAQTRIIEWYQKWDGHVIVSFSGGKDSTVLLHLVRSIYPDVEAVYCDTGLEYPEIKQFVKQHDNVTIVRPAISYRQVIEKYGYPVISKDVSRKIYYARRGSEWAQRTLRGENADGTRTDFMKQYAKWEYLVDDAPFRISARCCDIMKKQPMKKYQHSCHKFSIVGTMAAESKLRENSWMRNGCNAFDSADPKSAPLSIWTEQDVLKYILDHNLDIASVYGDIIRDAHGRLTTSKCKRTGCVFCGFGAHLEKEPNRFQRLKQTHPKLWEYCMRDFDMGGLGMRDVLDYLHIPSGADDPMTLQEYLDSVKEVVK